MRPIIRLLLGSIALILLTSCGIDPRKEAQAYETRSSADQQSANQELARQQNSELHQYEMERREARAAAIDKTVNTIYGTIRIFGSFALAVSLIAIAASFWTASRGIAKATVTYAETRANLIHLDKVTRQFPLLQHVHGDRFALHNPNSGSVIMLNTSRDEDRQLISALGMTQLAGVIGHEARQSTDPAGMAMMRPNATHAQQEGLYIGDEYFDAKG